MKKKALLGAIFSGLILYGCGGGGGGGIDTGTSTTPSGGNSGVTALSSLSTYITDAPADQYPVFKATIYEIRLCNDTGCQTIFSDTSGVELDLTDLRGVLRYLGTANIPQGVYNRIEIDVGQNVTVVDNNGNTQSVQFTDINSQDVSVTCNAQNNECTITVNTTVDTSQTTDLAIDFNLSNFNVDETTGTITQIDVKPTTPQQDAAQQTQQPNYEYEITGVVKDITENSIVIAIAWMDKEFTINIDTNTVFDDVASINDIQIGYCIEAEVRENPAKSEALTAIELEVESLEECGIDEEEEQEELRRITGREDIGHIEDDDYDDEVEGRKEKVGVITNIDADNRVVYIDGNSYTLSENIVCEIEIEGLPNMNNWDNQNNMNNVDQNMNNSTGQQDTANTQDVTNTQDATNNTNNQDTNTQNTTDQVATNEQTTNDQTANDQTANTNTNTQDNTISGNENVVAQALNMEEEYIRDAQACIDRLNQILANLPEEGLIAEVKLNDNNEIVKIEIEMEMEEMMEEEAKEEEEEEYKEEEGNNESHINPDHENVEKDDEEKEVNEDKGDKEEDEEEDDEDEGNEED